MKTFEERYTEWIDGELRGAALIAFEEELARRAQAGEAQAEKVGAASLRALLREHLQAPELSNAEFFHHQLRERIEREGSVQRRIAVERAPAPTPWWSLARFRFIVPAGAAAVFVTSALYYASMPAKPGGTPALTAATHPAPALPPAPTPEPLAPRPSGGPVEMALNDVPPSPDLEAQTLDLSTSVTALKYKGANKNQDVQVLWMNGLEYQPEVPSPAPAKAAP